MQVAMSSVLPNLAPAAVALVTARAVLAGLMGPARRFDLLDRPGGRKAHAGAVPLTGGPALLAGMAAGALVSWGLGRAAWLPGSSGAILVFLAGVFALGLWDDAQGKSLGAPAKALVSAMLLTAFTLLAGPVSPVVLAVAFLVLHSFNTSDNMNGLAGGLALTGMAAWWLAASLGVVATPFPQTSAAGVGALVAFLVLNFPRGTVFLGDSGSLLLGGWFATAFLLHPHPGLLCFAALPLADLVTVALLRLGAGRRPWLGDRRHLSHRLARRLGGAEARAVGCLVAAQVVLNAAGIGLLAAVPAPGPGTWSLTLLAFAALALGALLVRDPSSGRA